jgi:Short C-terminal domain/Bacterial PH domain
MNLTDELQKLAELRREGVLSEQEFGEAKRKLLAQEPGEVPPSPPEGDKAGVADEADRVEQRTFWSSRWSSGNLFFRDSVVLAADGIMFRKRSLFGSKEEHINYRAIASVRVTNGVFLSNISIETSGGSQPIFINGLWKSDAREVQDGIRSAQEAV